MTMTEQDRLKIRTALAEKMDCYLLDPFNDAAAKDQLLKFVAAQPARVRLDFEHKLYLLILEGRNDDRFSLSPLDFMTASPEVVTLAAAKALGIETE